jgi:hypothetical protein
MTLEELEDELGPPSDFIPNLDSRKYLAKWALAIGIEPVQVYAMNLTQLTNLYHERGHQKSTELQRLAAQIFVNCVQSIQSMKVDPDYIRELVREELENIAPRKIEISTPTTTTILDGHQHYITETVIRIAALGHPIMLVGPAGCGKTTIGQQVSIALQLPFYITSTVNDTHELAGFVDGYGKYHRRPFRDAFEFGGIWVPDEIDAWDASALLAANSALANGYSVFPDSPVPVTRHPNFRVVATANTFGHGADRIYIGRNELDAATLDRFATINVDYDLQLERQFANGNIEWLQYVWKIRKAVTEKKIRHVVSSRAIIMGSAALQAGIERKDVEEIYLFKGMSTKDREKLDD